MPPLQPISQQRSVRNRTTGGRSSSIPLQLLFVALGILTLKVLSSIVWEYRWYFPADFSESFFLAGRQHYFAGSYRAAFYAHIICGPPVLLTAMGLAVSGHLKLRQLKSLRGAAFLRGAMLYRIHRWAGRVQVSVIVLVMLPTGLVMAQRSGAGPIAGVAFSVLSVLTAIAAVMAAVSAARGQMQVHQRWANRCLILLMSPILLRVTTGLFSVLQADSDAFYRFNAWFSWLGPLVIHEGYVFAISRRSRSTQVITKSNSLSEPVR